MATCVVFKDGALRVAASGESLALVDVRSDVLHIRDLSEGKCIARVYSSKGRAKLDLSPASQRRAQLGRLAEPLLAIAPEEKTARVYPEAIEALHAVGKTLLGEQEAAAFAAHAEQQAEAKGPLL